MEIKIVSLFFLAFLAVVLEEIVTWADEKLCLSRRLKPTQLFPANVTVAPMFWNFYNF